jgi:hypothetical protein
MSHPLEYAGSIDTQSDVLEFRRVRIIYVVGVAAVWAFLLMFQLNWPHTSNGADPRKAEPFMAEHVTGWAALTWLILGMRRIIFSRALRGDWLAWVAATANLMAICPIFWSGYQ